MLIFETAIFAVVANFTDPLGTQPLCFRVAGITPALVTRNYCLRKKIRCVFDCKITPQFVFRDLFSYIEIIIAVTNIYLYRK